jgi:heme exporter protein CcmD
LSYVVAAYGIVIVTLVGYAFWMSRARRKLIRQLERQAARPVDDAPA